MAITGIIAFHACQKGVTSSNKMETKTQSNTSCQDFWCLGSSKGNELLVTILNTTDSMNMIEWRYIKNEIFQFDQYAALVCTDMYDLSITNLTDTCFTIIANDGTELNVTNIENNDSTSQASVISSNDTASITIPIIDGITLLDYATYLESDSKGIKPPWQYPTNPWTFAFTVYKICKIIWDQIPLDCQEMFKQGASCQIRGCTPIYNFSNCTMKCRKYYGTPQERNCDDL